MKKKKRFLIIMLMMSLLLVALGFLFGHNESNKKLLPHDDTAKNWDGDQKLPTGNKSKLIEIPGFQSLVFSRMKRNKK